MTIIIPGIKKKYKFDLADHLLVTQQAHRCRTRNILTILLVTIDRRSDRLAIRISTKFSNPRNRGYISYFKLRYLQRT